MFGGLLLPTLLDTLGDLWKEEDKFKQRAAAVSSQPTLHRTVLILLLQEIMCGVMRGSKHWPKGAHSQLWAWVEERLGQIFDRIKPDTLRIWEGMLTVK